MSDDRSSDGVVHIRSVKTAADPDVVAACKELLARAERGELTSFICVGLARGGEIFDLGVGNMDMLVHLGLLAVATDSVLKAMNGER